MLVYVINKNGNPLMPCKEAKTRKLLRDNKAKVVKRTIFTIQLNWDPNPFILINGKSFTPSHITAIDFNSIFFSLEKFKIGISLVIIHTSIASVDADI